MIIFFVSMIKDATIWDSDKDRNITLMKSFNLKILSLIGMILVLIIGLLSGVFLVIYFNKASGFFYHEAAFIIFGLILLVVIIWLSIQSYIARPLIDIQKTVEAVTLNGYGVKVRPHGPVEINTLGNSFNQMISRLEEDTTRLQETRDYLANIVNYTDDVIISTDMNRRIVSFNRGGEKILGYTEAEVLGMDVRDLYPDPEERWALMRHVADMGSVSNYEVQHIHKDGHLVDISLTLSQLKDKSGAIIGHVGISKDITRHKEIEEKLRLQRLELKETRDYMASVLENTGDIIITTDLNSNIVSFNHGGETVLGFDRKEVIGEPESIFYADPEERSDLIKRLEKEGVITNYETRVKHKNGTFIDINLSLSQIKNEEGKVLGSVSISNDIRQRKTLERELRESNWRFTQFINMAHDIIVIKDLEGRYQVINPQAAGIFGLTPDECLGRTDFELFPESLARALTRMDKKILTKKDYSSSEESLTIAGEKRYFNSVRFPLPDYQGNVVGVCTISRDITEQKHLQQAVIQSEKMAAVGKLAASVAHEINNPLTGILTFTEELKIDAEPESELAADYDTIIQETLRCRSIVRDLLDYARMEKPRQEDKDINEVVEKSLSLVRKQSVFQNVCFELSLTEGLPLARIDPNQIQQVLLNLIINAGESMEGGGQIRIETFLAEKGNQVEIHVSDNGSGIPEEVQKQIFEPFYSTKGRKGNGLGLSVVQSIIEQHEGSVTVKSEPGKGTTFSVSLPKGLD